jgi:hypothetical protein
MSSGEGEVAQPQVGRAQRDGDGGNDQDGTAPIAEKYKVANFKITMIRVAFDARQFGPTRLDPGPAGWPVKRRGAEDASPWRRIAAGRASMRWEVRGRDFPAIRGCGGVDSVR